MSRWLSVYELAKACGVTPRTAYKWVYDGMVAYRLDESPYRKGRRVVVDADSLITMTITRPRKVLQHFGMLEREPREGFERETQ